MDGAFLEQCLRHRRIIEFTIIAQLDLIAMIRYIDDAGIRIVTGVGTLLADGSFLRLSFIEHHTITHCKPPLGQSIGELQVDIIVEDIPTLIRILLTGHLEISLKTQRHRQLLREQRRIQLRNT